MTVFARPDLGWGRRLQEEETRQVERDLAATDEARRQELAVQAKELAERQAAKPDTSCLPELFLSDVPRHRRWAEPLENGGKLTQRFVQPTNGILNEVCVFRLQDLDPEELALLPILTQGLGQLGVGSLDYTEQARRLTSVCGGLGARINLFSLADPSLTAGLLICETQGLENRHERFVGLVPEMLRDQRFDEIGRLHELVSETLSSLHSRVIREGHSMAAAAATRGFGGRAGISHRFEGLGALEAYRQLEESLREDVAKGASELTERCLALLARLRATPVTIALIGDAVEDEKIVANTLSAWEGFDVREALPSLVTLDAVPGPRNVAPTAFTTGTSVNYCALALRGVTLEHEDAAPLAVSARYLTNGFLHTAIREKGGAYGASASANQRTGTFVITSYRDPRLQETFEDIARGLDWLGKIDDDERPLREAILSVIAGVDSPGSPASEAKSRFLGELRGRTPEVIEEFRRRVLSVTPADIRRVAREHLVAENATRAVVTSPEAAKTLEGWDTVSV